MLGFLKPRGELVELSGRQVVFLAEKPYKRDAQFAIKLSLPEPSDVKVDMDVRVLSHRPGPKDKYVIVGVVETPRDYPNLQGHPLRMSRRDPHRVTLKSGELPGYRAVTQDLSSGGFKTELEGELVVQDQIVVTLEFDQLQGFTIDLLAEVAWVDNRGGGKFKTGFRFPEQGSFAENYQWLVNWLENREDTEVKKLFRQVAVHRKPEPLNTQEPEREPEPEPLPKDLSIRIPFKGFLRGWAWEQGDDMVVIVLEDDEGNDHWVEFPGCRGLHARCRDRKIRLQGVKLVTDSDMIQEYSRSVTFESLYHFSFLDDYARVVLDVIASGCREQVRTET